MRRLIRLTSWLLATLLALASTATAQITPPAQLKVTTVVKSPTQYYVGLQYTLPGAPDSVLTSVKQSTTIVASRRKKGSLAEWYARANPAKGVTVSGTACVQSKKGTALSAQVCGPWSFKLPPDSLRIMAGFIRPDVVVSQPTATLCMLYQFGNGRYGYRGPRTPACEGYRMALGPAVTPAQQAVLDSWFGCTTWRTTGDPVTPTGPCSGVATVGRP